MVYLMVESGAENSFTISGGFLPEWRATIIIALETEASSSRRSLWPRTLANSVRGAMVGVKWWWSGGRGARFRVRALVN